MRIIYIGADHGGWQLKEALKLFLTKANYQVEDLGNKKFQPKDDYPDFAAQVARAVVKKKSAAGLLVCHSGVGMCVAANKIKGARAAVITDIVTAREAVEDVNLNVICFGQGHLNIKTAQKIIIAFLSAKFSQAQRHQRRINKIAKL